MNKRHFYLLCKKEGLEENEKKRREKENFELLHSDTYSIIYISTVHKQSPSLGFHYN